jgi:PIN domain nuclease of toxin-antitoxin system
MAGGGAMILDTCALLWLASGDKKLSRSALKEIKLHELRVVTRDEQFAQYGVTVLL